MRRRLSCLLALALLIVPVVALPSQAQGAERTFAQTTEEEEDEGIVGEEEEAENPGTGEDEGQEPETETGAGEEETVEAEEEAGPIWTYQMSKIGLVLLFLMLLAIGGAYWNFVAKRQKQGF